MKQFLKVTFVKYKFINIDKHVEKKVNIFVNFIILNLQWDIQKYY